MRAVDGQVLRFDRDGRPVPFEATGTNALLVDHPMRVGFWHDVYQGMDVDRHGTIYYAAKAEADTRARPVSAYDAVHRQVDVYDARGERKAKGLLRLDAVRGIQVDDDGCLYVLHRPVRRPWEDHLALAKFSPSGGKPLWTRRWDSYFGFAQVANPPCHCTAFRFHQSLDGKGYLFAAGKYSVQVVDCATGERGDASIARFTLERPGMEWVLLGSAGGCWVSEEHGSLGWDPIASGFILGAIRGVCGIAHRVGASEGHSIPRHGGPCQPGAQHMHHATPGLPP